MASIIPRRLVLAAPLVGLLGCGHTPPQGQGQTPDRLSREQVLTEVRRAAPFIGECGALALADDPPVVQTTYVVEPDGHTHGARLVGQPSSPALGRCVADRADTMRYPRFAGAPMQLTMPFELKRARTAPAPADVAAPGEVRVDGPCDAVAIVRALPTDALHACRAAWPGATAETHPPFSVAWRIGAGGRAEDVRIGAGTMEPKVAGCVVEAIALASQPETTAECAVVVGYPWPAPTAPNTP